VGENRLATRNSHLLSALSGRLRNGPRRGLISSRNTGPAGETHPALDVPLSGSSVRAQTTHWSRRLTQVERGNIDWNASIRSAVLIAIPVGIALTTGMVAQGVFAAIGCFNVVLLQFEGSQLDRLRRSGWGLGLNAVAIALGTAVGTLGIVAIPFVAVGLIVGHLVTRIPRSGALMLTVSALFVIGVGLPGSSLVASGERGLLVLLGGGLGVGGLFLHLVVFRWLGKGDFQIRPMDGRRSPVLSPIGLPGLVQDWGHAVAVGVTAAFGLALSTWAGLARDYWVMLTVVVVLRPKIEDTLTIGVARVIGTFVGAVLAVLVTVGLPQSPVQGVLIVVFVLGSFIFIGVNYTLYAVFLTAFVIILLNLGFPGGLVLAETRVLDTAVGGLLALVVASALWTLKVGPFRPDVPAAHS